MQFSVRFNVHVQFSLAKIFDLVGFPSVVVEIGCFEGETTFNLAQTLLNAKKEHKYYAIDPFLATENLTQEVLDAAKAAFKANLLEGPPVEFIEKSSFDGLLELHNRGVKADLIYVDGSHFAKDVLKDAVLSFELLNVGGVMLFDDAVSWRYGNNIQDNPKIAIDNFIQCNWDRLEVLDLPTGYQVAVRRTA